MQLPFLLHYLHVIFFQIFVLGNNMSITESAIFSCNLWSEWVLRDTSFPECRQFGFFLWDVSDSHKSNRSSFNLFLPFNFILLKKLLHFDDVSNIWMICTNFSFCCLGSYFGNKNPTDSMSLNKSSLGLKTLIWIPTDC